MASFNDDSLTQTYITYNRVLTQLRSALETNSPEAVVNYSLAVANLSAAITNLKDDVVREEWERP